MGDPDGALYGDLTENPRMAYVEIVDYDGRVEKRMGPFDARKADRVERGVNINLDHSRYFTRFVDA